MKNKFALVFLPGYFVLLATCFTLVGDICAKTPTNDAKKEWAQWRGPNRDGISNETGIIKAWSAGGPKILWRTESGDGYSAMSISKNRLFTTWGKKANEVAVCLDANTGKQIWRYIFDSKFTSSYGHGPRATPTVDGNLVYVISGKGNLAALDATNGAEIWKHELKKEYGAKIPKWGVSTSPLVYKNLLLVDVGGSGNHGFMAFNKKSGKLTWETATELPGYSSPVLAKVAGVEHVLNFTGNSLISVDPANGKQRWSYPWRTSYAVNAATPIFITPDKVFISTGYGVGAAVLKIGTNSAQQIWKSKVMRNHFTSSIIVGDYLYGFDDATLRCVNLKTQESLWGKRGLGKGSFLYADGHLIVLSERGKLVLVEATPSSYVEKAQAQMLKGRCWTVPTLLNGKLYIRNQKELLCLDFAEK